MSLYAYSYDPLSLSVVATTAPKGQVKLTYSAPKAGTFSILYPMPDDIEALIASLDGFHRYGDSIENIPEQTTDMEPPLSGQDMVVNVIGELLSHGPENLRLRPGVSF